MTSFARMVLVLDVGAVITRSVRKFFTSWYYQSRIVGVQGVIVI